MARKPTPAQRVAAVEAKTVELDERTAGLRQYDYRAPRPVLVPTEEVLASLREGTRLAAAAGAKRGYTRHPRLKEK